MSQINYLGNNYIVNLNAGNGFSSTSATLFPAIGSTIPAAYFRVLSNHICVVDCSFAKVNDVVASDGTLSQNRNIPVGNETMWFQLKDQVINNSVVTLVDPIGVLDAITLVFEFVNKIPSELTF
jgi:hypothetical protein